MKIVFVLIWKSESRDRNTCNNQILDKYHKINTDNYMYDNYAWSDIVHYPFHESNSFKDFLSNNSFCNSSMKHSNLLNSNPEKLSQIQAR